MPLETTMLIALILSANAEGPDYNSAARALVKAQMNFDSTRSEIATYRGTCLPDDLNGGYISELKVDGPADVIAVKAALDAIRPALAGCFLQAPETSPKCRVTASIGWQVGGHLVVADTGVIDPSSVEIHFYQLSRGFGYDYQSYTIEVYDEVQSCVRKTVASAKFPKYDRNEGHATEVQFDYDLY